jgi:hypothetical protein
MTTLKTVSNDASVDAFLQTVTDEKKRQDCYALLTLMQEITGCAPTLWGSSIVGFGRYHYRYASGHEGEASLAGFSPRKQNITLYLPGGLGNPEGLAQKLGQVKTGKGCLYLSRLTEVNREGLREVIQDSLHALRQRPEVRIIP